MRHPQVRDVDDPWWTALYRYPHTVWWGWGVASFISFFGVHFLVWDDSLLESAAVACVVGGLSAYLCRGALD